MIRMFDFDEIVVSLDIFSCRYRKKTFAIKGLLSFVTALKRHKKCYLSQWWCNNVGKNFIDSPNVAFPRS